MRKLLFIVISLLVSVLTSSELFGQLDFNPPGVQSNSLDSAKVAYQGTWQFVDTLTNIEFNVKLKAFNSVSLSGTNSIVFLGVYSLKQNGIVIEDNTSLMTPLLSHVDIDDALELMSSSFPPLWGILLPYETFHTDASFTLRDRTSGGVARSFYILPDSLSASNNRLHWNVDNKLNNDFNTCIVSYLNQNTELSVPRQCVLVRVSYSVE
ncbi:MAG: hypothetical protein J6Z32_02780 [Bacteroidales bacterium]|nr:hypothetical protein [Bacteroidales bacterium]